MTMKKAYLITIIVASYALAIVVLLQLVQYVYLKAMDFIGRANDLDSIPIFRDLFAKYGCSDYESFKEFLAQNTETRYVQELVDGQIVTRTYTVYSPSASRANEEFTEITQHLPYYLHHDPVGTLSVDPNIIMLCILLPVVILLICFCIRSANNYFLRKERHERFMASNIPDGVVPHSGMRYYDTDLGTDNQISDAEYSHVVKEYLKVKSRCWTSEKDKKLFKAVDRHTRRIIDADGKTYPVASVIMSTGKTLVCLGSVLCAAAIILEALTMLLCNKTEAFTDLSTILYYFVVSHQFTAFQFIVMMIPVGLLMMMAARIMMQLKKDPLHYRLVVKYMVQGYTEEDLIRLNMMRDDYNGSDMLMLARPEVNGNGRP